MSAANSLMTVVKVQRCSLPSAVVADKKRCERDQRPEHRVLSTVAHSLIRGSKPHSDHTSEGCLDLRSEVPDWLLTICRRVPSTVPMLRPLISLDDAGELP